MGVSAEMVGLLPPIGPSTNISSGQSVKGLSLITCVAISHAFAQNTSSLSPSSKTFGGEPPR